VCVCVCVCVCVYASESALCLDLVAWAALSSWLDPAYKTMIMMAASVMNMLIMETIGFSYLDPGHVCKDICRKGVLC
jgi:hypothetical protein